MVYRNDDYRDLLGVTTSEGQIIEQHEFFSNDSNNISQLCVPQDRLEDLDFFPNFKDDLIPLRELLSISEHEYLNQIESSKLERERDLWDKIASKKEPKKDSWDEIEFKKESKKGLWDEIQFKKEPEKNSWDEIEFKKVPKKNSCQRARDVEMEPFSSKDSSSSHDDDGEVLSLSPPPVSPDSSDSTEFEINDDICSSRNIQWVNSSKKKRSKRARRESRNNFTKRRRCSHCEAENTPQWRMGPEGPKTLCNACGVRYKSGRLVPEYRPAASPSFDSMKHSNFHRRIMQKKIMFRQ
ncbi:GATA transcription factor 12 [Sesamum alatum]|uniref:GATA transcription factor 12 n=1 Tax=Sesamum alatum TaxID=300844 RepID=A0AAE1XS54_9LAMI|nr:GATA transcription factor 12 [Sesamum alatum]